MTMNSESRNKLPTYIHLDFQQGCQWERLVFSMEIKDLNIKVKLIKLIEENIHINLYWTGHLSVILNNTPYTEALSALTYPSRVLHTFSKAKNCSIAMPQRKAKIKIKETTVICSAPPECKMESIYSNSQVLRTWSTYIPKPLKILKRDQKKNGL